MILTFHLCIQVFKLLMRDMQLDYRLDLLHELGAEYLSKSVGVDAPPGNTLYLGHYFVSKVLRERLDRLMCSNPDATDCCTGKSLHVSYFLREESVIEFVGGAMIDWSLILTNGSFQGGSVHTDRKIF